MYNRHILFFVYLLLIDSVLSQSRFNRRQNANGETTLSRAADVTNVVNTENILPQVEYRLTRLEVQVTEKSEVIRSELRDVIRRMQSLEWQNAEARASLDGLKGEISRFTEQSHVRHVEQRANQNDNANLEEKYDGLVRGVQLVVAAIRGLTSDVNAVKANISALLNKTESLYESNKHLVTKRFFNNGIAEIKYDRISSSNPQQLCAKPELYDLMKTVPKDCREIMKRDAKSRSGVYKIKPDHSPKPFMVYCDMTTNGGGWTLIQNRFDGSEDFYLNWHDYKYGFGNIGGEFWLGLENIYLLTGNDIHELYVDLKDLMSENVYAYYSTFSIGSEMEGYPLKVLGGYNGTAGDSLQYHAGSKFSTKDMDQDLWSEGSCAQAHGGAWWYRACDKCNLNGRYLSGELPDELIYQGMYWGDFKGPKYSLMSSKMMVRVKE